MKTLNIIFALILTCVSAYSQFITEVIEYKPAPGQYINSSPWGVPDSESSIIGGVTGSMSLGAFGGYVVFKFENPVENHQDNPFGVDFTIFGNPLNDWSEPGIVSVMKDENNNGLPDDTWYELAGSDYFFSSTLTDYEVTYTNPNQAEASDVAWNDNYDESGYIFSNGFHSQPYYPMSENFPTVNQIDYTLTGTRITDEIDKSNSANIKSYMKAFGYVDNQIRGSAPYTTPDNPYTAGKENSGGDAFDIDWAVNIEGEYVKLDAIDFVKVHTAVLGDGGWLGEISTEITGAVDVSPNSSLSGINKAIVLKSLPDTIHGENYQLEVAVFSEGRLNENENIVWSNTNSSANINDSKILSFSQSGEITITASLESNPEITTSKTVYLSYNTSNIFASKTSDIDIFPNPTVGNISISGTNNCTVIVYNTIGTQVLKIENYTENSPIDLSNMPASIYFIKTIDSESNSHITKIVKK